MVDQGIDVLMLSVGHDLPYLTGYLAMPLERLTMLVVPRDGEASLLIPQLEAPRVVEHPDVFTLVPWGETADPIELAAELADGASTIAVGDQMWARFLVELLPHLPGRPSVARSTSSGRCGWSRMPLRSPRSALPATPPIGSPTSCTPARSHSWGAPRRRSRRTSLPDSSPRATSG